MTKSGETTGTFRNGMPYNRLGHGPRILVVLQGLVFENKPLYTETLLRETAEGIPNAKLILYPGKGHAPAGKQFGQDVLTFLNSG